jgi:hypothetical protein
MLTKPWEVIAGKPDVAVVIISIANFGELADVGMHALGRAIQFVEDVVDRYFPASSRRQRVEWLSVCVCLERADSHDIGLYMSRITEYLDENDLEIPQDGWIDAAWVPVRVVSGIATSRLPVADGWPLVLVAAREVNRALEALPPGSTGSPIQPTTDFILESR